MTKNIILFCLLTLSSLGHALPDLNNLQANSCGSFLGASDIESNIYCLQSTTYNSVYDTNSKLSLGPFPGNGLNWSTNRLPIMGADIIPFLSESFFSATSGTTTAITIQELRQSDTDAVNNQIQPQNQNDFSNLSPP